MRAVVQRVSSAKVTVDDRVTGEIGAGLLAFIGVEQGDTADDVRYIASKIAGLRIFAGDGKGMNRSIAEIGGAVLVVSQFTLVGRRAQRPASILRVGRTSGDCPARSTKTSCENCRRVGFASKPENFKP